MGGVIIFLPLARDAGDCINLLKNRKRKTISLNKNGTKITN